MSSLVFAKPLVYRLEARAWWKLRFKGSWEVILSHKDFDEQGWKAVATVEQPLRRHDDQFGNCILVIKKVSGDRSGLIGARMHVLFCFPLGYAGACTDEPVITELKTRLAGRIPTETPQTTSARLRAWLRRVW